MGRPRKEGIGRIGMWVEGISYQNPYPEFETELIKTYSKKCFKSIRGFWRVRDRPNQTPRPSSDSDSKNGTKERFDRL